MSYEIVRQAIVEHASLTAHYEDYIRHFSPHILGKHSNGAPVVIAFQYSGGKPGGLLGSGEWCRFLLPRLHYVRRNGDRWLAGPIHGKPVDGLTEIDVAA
jgi:hypothetical protein